MSIHRFVQPDTSLTIGRNRRDFIQLDKDNLFLTGYDSAARQEAAAPAPGLSFRDTHGTLTEEQVKTETTRCLGCGASVVDPNKCIGCGICTTKCKFDAIRLEKVNDTHGREYFRTLLTVAGNTPAAIGRLVRKTRGR